MLSSSKHRREKALTTGRPAIEPDHICLCSRFIKEDKTFRVHRVGSSATPCGLRRYRRGLVQRRAMTFFERQPEMPQPFPKATGADLRGMLRDKPGLQLGKRRIGLVHHMGAKGWAASFGLGPPAQALVCPVL